MIKARGITETEIAEGIAATERQMVSDEAQAYLRKTDWSVFRAAERFLIREGYLAAEFGTARDAARERITSTGETS